MAKILKTVFTWIWCFPQMLVGLIVKLATKAERHGEFYRYNAKGGSVSLGTYIFLCKAHWNDEETQRHEKGHTVQSYYLGWLYLLVIGLPSIIWCNLFEEYRQKHGIIYEAFYTEKWADKIAGIKRDDDRM